MPGGEVGNAWVGISTKFEEDPKTTGERLGTGLSSGMKGTFGAGAVAMGNILSDVLSKVASVAGDQVAKTFWNYADYEQLVGGVETLFKDASDTVTTNAKNAFKTAGMSANEYMENVTAFSASLISSLDGDTQKAADYANRAMVDMSDNANKMGTSMDEIVRAYQSMARGNFGMLDSLKIGYGGTKAEMERLIKDASQMTDVQKQLGVTVDESSMSFDNIVNAISVMQTQMGIAGATEEEAAGTISGSLAMLSSAWDNFLTAVGDGGRTMDLTQSVSDLVDSFGAAASNVVPALARIGEAIVVDLPPILGAAITEAMQGFPEAFSNAVNSAFSGDQADRIINNILMPFGELDKAFAQLGQTMEPFTSNVGPALMVILNGLVELISALVGSVALLAAGMAEMADMAIHAAEDLWNGAGEAINSLNEAVSSGWSDLKEATSNTWNAIKQIPTNAANAIKTGLTSVFNACRSVVQSVWNAIANAIRTATNTAKSVVSTAVHGIKGAFRTLSSIAGTVRGAFNQVKQAITQPIETAKSTLKGILDRIKGMFPLNIGNVFSGIKLPQFHVSPGSFPWGVGGKGSMPSFSIDWYAHGGILDNMQLIGAGERGTEFIWPAYDPYMSKYAKAIASNMPTQNNGITVNFTYNGEGDATDAVNLLTSNLRQLRATGAF